MNVVGFDIGNANCVVAVATQDGIDVVFNDESDWETPAVICFGNKQRVIGTAEAASKMTSPLNTISQIKTLIGRQYSDPYLQRHLKSMPFLVTEGRDGVPLIHVRYLGEQRTFTPTQLLGMLFSYLKGLAEKHMCAQALECCIGIPIYFTDLQRRAVIDAATIADLYPLQLIHETTATALDYGDKANLTKTNTVNIAIVDIGHSSMQVSVVRLKKGQLKVLAHSFDLSLGGRDFDEVLFQHLAAKFNEENTIDVFQSATAGLKLRAACEKLKKALTVFQEAPLNIEHLIEGKDVRALIKREEFEEISLPILEKVKQLLEKVLGEANLTVDNIHAVEVLGSGSRIPAIVKVLTEFFGKHPHESMDSRWCVAKGCALQGAILSEMYKAKEFQIIERFPFTISLSLETTCAVDPAVIKIIPRGSVMPCLKVVSVMPFYSGSIVVDVQYSDVSDLQATAKISSCAIGPFFIRKKDNAKLKIEVRLNLHGIVSIESAFLLKNEDSTVPLADEKPLQKVNEVAIPVSEVIYGGLSEVDIQKANMEGWKMNSQDSEAKKVNDSKTALGAYIYDMKHKLHNKYLNFVTRLEKYELMTTLLEMEDWLHGDGENENKSTYSMKLEELKRRGDPIEQRYKEAHGAIIAVDMDMSCLGIEALFFSSPST